MSLCGLAVAWGQCGQPGGTLRGPSDKPMNKTKNNLYRMLGAVYSFRKRSEG